MMNCEICNRPLMTFDTIKPFLGYALCPTCDATLDDNQKRGSIMASKNAKKEQEYQQKCQADKLERQQKDIAREVEREAQYVEYSRNKQEYNEDIGNDISYDEYQEQNSLRRDNEHIQNINLLRDEKIAKLSDEEMNSLWLFALRNVAKHGKQHIGKVMAAKDSKISERLANIFFKRMIDEGLFTYQGKIQGVDYEHLSRLTGRPSRDGVCDYEKINNLYLAKTPEGRQLDLKTMAFIRKRNKYIKIVALIFVIAIGLFVRYKKYI